MKKRKLLIQIGVCAGIILAIMTFLIHKNQSSKAREIADYSASIQSDSSMVSDFYSDKDSETDKASSDRDSLYADMIPEMQRVCQAIDATTSLSAFSLTTDSSISLTGNLIKGDFNFQSDIRVSGNHSADGNDSSKKQSENGLKMDITSKNSLSSSIVTGSYADGIYKETKDGVTEETPKSESEVMSLVSDVTDLVFNAATEITETAVSTDDTGNTTYTYEVPAMITKSYLRSLVADLEIEELEGANVDIDSTTFISTINSDGLIVQQEILIDGSVKKAIIKVPANADIVATFKVQ